MQLWLVFSDSGDDRDAGSPSETVPQTVLLWVDEKVSKATKNSSQLIFGQVYDEMLCTVCSIFSL